VGQESTQHRHINHFTDSPDSANPTMMLANPKGNEPIYSLAFINILSITGQYPLWHADSGTGNCGQGRKPMTSIRFTTYVRSATTV